MHERSIKECLALGSQFASISKDESRAFMSSMVKSPSAFGSVQLSSQQMWKMCIPKQKTGVILSLPSLARRMWNFALTLGKKIEKGKNNLWKLGPWTIWANRPVDSLECLCRQRTYDVPWPKRIEAVWIQLEQLEPMPRRLDMPVSYIPQRAVVLSTMLPKSPRLRSVQVLNEWRYCPGIRFRWDLEDLHDLKNVRSQKRSQKRSKNTENFKKQAGMEAGNCDAKTPRSCEDGKANKSDDDCALCKEILGPNPLFENALPRSSPLKQESSQIKHDLPSHESCLLLLMLLSLLWLHPSKA